MELEVRLARIEALTAILERCNDVDTRAAARELVATLMDLHGAGIAGILELISGAGEAGTEIGSLMVRDSLIATLLLLHQLHPEPLESRIRAALGALRPRIGAHATVDWIELEGDLLRLKLTGSCGGCPSSMVSLKKTLEDGIFAVAPDLAAIEFVEAGSTSPGHLFLPVITL